MKQPDSEQSEDTLTQTAVWIIGISLHVVTALERNGVVDVQNALIRYMAHKSPRCRVADYTGVGGIFLNKHTGAKLTDIHTSSATVELPVYPEGGRHGFSIHKEEVQVPPSKSCSLSPVCHF